MRHIKKLLVLFLVLTAITSCEKEEVSYALQDISAPTDINAIFDISQDEVGLVTLTPTGQGASSFEVYFGDVENESPTIVNPGETISHTYAEGEYNLRIVAVGLTGLTSELVRVVTVSFDPPTDLEVDIKISTTNPFELLVTPTATNATVYDVYFGDVEDEEPLTIMDTETATHVYAEAGTYTVRVVARGGGAATVEYTEEVTITGAVNAVTLPITFEDATVNYAASGFGAADFGPIPAEVIDNPDASGINTTAKVLSVNKLQDAQVWAGASIPLAGPIDFTNSTTVSMKVWSPRAGTPILFKIEDSSSERDGNGNPTVFVEIQTSTTLINTWEEITFDLSTIDSFDAANSYDTAIVFPDFGTAGKGELFYFDDIMLVGATADCVAETEENIDFANGPINWTFKTNDEDHEFDQFGDITTDIVANPVTDGINPSCSVQMIEKTEGCATWSGLGQAIPTAIDFTTTDKKVFKLKVLAQDQLAAVTLRLEKEPFPDVDPAEDRVAQITELGVWQELTFDFSDVDDKTFRSIIIYFERDIACDGDVYYFDDLVQTDGGIGGGTALTLPFNFETAPVTSDFIDFDGGIATVVDNTQPTGNSSAKVAQIIRDGGQVWGGSKIILDSKIDFSTQGAFSMKVFTTAPIGTNVIFKLEDSTNGDINAEVGAVTTVTGAWDTLTFDFTGKPSNTYDALVFLFDLGNVGDGSANSTFLFDDIMQVDLTEGKSQIDLPVDFESSTVDYTLTDFGDNVSSVIVDPYDANNMAAKVIKTNTAATWAGTTIGTASGFATNIPITLTNSKMTVRVWSPDAGTPIRLKIEDANDVTHTCETETNTTVTAGWETIEFDFANQAPGTESLSVGLANGWVYNKASIFFNFGTDGATAGEKTYYFDDVLFIQ